METLISNENNDGTIKIVKFFRIRHFPAHDYGKIETDLLICFQFI